jgi:hypothetical protein
VCAVGLLAFLPAFRARERRQPRWATLFTIGGVAVLGLLAIGLQQFTVPYVMTGFGPSDTTMTPVGLIFRTGFLSLKTGAGAAVGVVLLLILAVLGVATVFLVILTRLRLSLLPRQRPFPVADPTASTSRRNPAATVVAALALIAVLVVVVLTMRPWLDALSGPTPEGSPDAGRSTWLPAITGAVLSVGVAYLAALGVSGLRPLGRRSEWLLLPFAPWLFVGVAPLSVAFVTSLQDQSLLDSDRALHPPIQVSILSMLVMAVLCRGQSQHWQRQVAAGAAPGPAFLRSVALPTLPLAGFLVVVSIAVSAQDLFWPLLVTQSPERGTTTLGLLRAYFGLTGTDFSVAAATPLLMVVLGGLALAAIQVLHLDRMIAATGRDDEPATPATPGTPAAG